MIRVSRAAVLTGIWLTDPPLSFSSPSMGYKTRKSHVDLAFPELFCCTWPYQQQLQNIDLSLTPVFQAGTTLFQSDWHKFIGLSQLQSSLRSRHVWQPKLQLFIILWTWLNQTSVMVTQLKCSSKCQTSMTWALYGGDWPGTGSPPGTRVAFCSICCPLLLLARHQRSASHYELPCTSRNK